MKWGTCSPGSRPEPCVKTSRHAAHVLLGVAACRDRQPMAVGGGLVRAATMTLDSSRTRLPPRPAILSQPIHPGSRHHATPSRDMD
jgi:hypothetical protein